MDLGCVRPFDLFACRQFHKPDIRYGFLEVMWAFVADIDLESEKLRWAGSSRFLLMTIIRLLRLRQYKATLYYVNSNDQKPHNENNAIQNKGSTRPSLQYISSLTTAEQPLTDWKKVEANFTYFMAMNTPWCASDVLPAPKARLSDGALDLVWIADASLRKMLRCFLDTESGKYVEESYVQYEKVAAFLLVPDQKMKGFLDVDGEKFDYEPIAIECIPSVARLIVPKRHDESIWCKQ